MLSAAPIVYSVAEAIDLSGERGDYVAVEHAEALALTNGTFVVNFTADDVEERQALFSKDASGLEDGGHLTAFVNDGRVEVRLQSGEKSEWAKTGEILTDGQEHELAVAFGDDGFFVYVDGRIEAWETGFFQGIEANDNDLAIGANTWARTESNPTWTADHFAGTISGFTVYGGQLDRNEVAALAGLPGRQPLATPTVIDGVLRGTDGNDILPPSRATNGGFGEDKVVGTAWDDVLDGGEGEDRLFGKEGDDLIISRSDGREPVIAQDYDSEDDPYGEIDPTTRTLYSNQPVAGDDLMFGGPGADTFRFEILVNAKRDIILKHVNDDRTIDWHGVTGENRNVHDHWVDRIGDDSIWDFNRAEGDKIEFVGHTVDVYDLTHHDSNGDGVLDTSVLHVQSNQGNAGAHNKDQLGTVTVYGDLLTASDYTVDARPAPGIVETIDELNEAESPINSTPLRSPGRSRWASSIYVPRFLDHGALAPGEVLRVPGEVPFSGERGDYLLVEHTEAVELENGTVSLRFSSNDVQDKQALFSKDASGLENGGHLTAFVNDGRVEVRLQSAEKSEWAKTKEILDDGEEYELTVTFGDDGLWVYVDGRLEAWETGFDQGIEANLNDLAVGANIWGRSAENPEWASDFFEGTISELTFHDRQMTRAEVAALAGVSPPAPLTETTEIDGVLVGTDDGETLAGVRFANGSYGDDVLVGTSEADTLDGGEGEDQIDGGDGDDLLISRSDGREPVIAQLYDSDDDPYGEINPETRTLYPDQPIASDDVLTGGGGADTFRFEILVNAKRDIILKHVNDDRTIDWHGVTGENRNVHDHWVDRFGDEVITDFNRAEGDFIEFIGHTVDVYKVTHQDSDGDGVLDSSVLHVQSNQGNAGAHNKDQLGTVTVFGDLVTESDYTVNAKPAPGIVRTLDELDHALAPRFGTPVVTDGESRWLPDEVQDAPLPDGAVLLVPGEVSLSGEKGDYLQVEHGEPLALESGTVAMSFTVDETDGRQTLLSKDHRNFQDGGHLTISVAEDRVEVRLQSDSRSEYLKSAPGSVEAGREYALAVVFGADGFRLYLDGELVDAEDEFTQGISANANSLVIGASTTTRDGDRLNLKDYFDGVIEDLTVYGEPLGADDLGAIDQALAEA
ncbi:MAG: LamG-like jellyroll fold domain-containing protein [Planctomycetota bacterium]